MSVGQAGECPRGNTPEGQQQNKFMRKEGQNINSCHPLKLNNIKHNRMAVHLISVAKITGYKLLSKIKS